MNTTSASRRIAAIAACALVTCALAAVAAACSGDDGTTTTISTVPVPSASPAPLTGIAEVDHLINAALAGDVIELAALTGYHKIACDAEVPEGGDVPKCREDEAAGDEVEVLASSGCERSWVRPELVPQAYRSVLESGAVAPFAVYKPNDGPETFGGGFGAQYVVVLSTGKRGDGSPAGVALHIKNGRVTWLERECTQLLELVSSDRVESFIVDPAAAANDAATPADAAATPAP